MGPTVIGIEVERTKAVTITFDDGVVCSFPLPELRHACPCAGCRAKRERGDAAWTAGAVPIEIVDAELAGNWGLSLRWNDGHDTGIYPWDSLRRWHDGVVEGIVG
jgi:DUF971 family protein